MNDIGLKDKELASINSVFSIYPKITSATVFGSRALGNHKKYADIDIALKGELDIIDIGRIHGDLEELPLIFLFDLVAYETLKNTDLKDHIDRVGVEIYKRID